MGRSSVVGVATAAALIGLAGCNSNSGDSTASGAAPSAVPIIAPSPTPGASSDPAAREPVPAGKSRIDIALNDCEGCIVTAYVPLVKGEDLKTWASKPVADGLTSLIVPTEATHAMSFDVQGTQEHELTFGDARPAVVLAYRKPAGGKQQGNWCWAGTSDSVVSLTIRHQRLPADGFVGALPTDDHEDVFDATPAFPVVAGEWQPSESGGLGHQDAPYCKG